MELCDDDEQQKQQRNEHQYSKRDLRKEPERCSSASGAFLLLAATATATATALSSPTSSSCSGSYTINGSQSHPSTSSGLSLLTSASALHIFDNNSPPPTHSHAYAYRPTSKSTGLGLFTRSHSSTTSSTGNGVGNGDQCAGNERAVFRGIWSSSGHASGRSRNASYPTVTMSHINYLIYGLNSTLKCSHKIYIYIISSYIENGQVLATIQIEAKTNIRLHSHVRLQAASKGELKKNHPFSLWIT